MRYSLTEMLRRRRAWRESLSQVPGDVAALRAELAATRRDLDRMRTAIGRIEARTSPALAPGAPLANYEYQVYSQFGEDGIIQHLIGLIPEIDPSFVEIGVEDYREANTRFLLEKDHWRGLLVDADASGEDAIRGSAYFWSHDVQLEIVHVTRENVESILRRYEFCGPLGLLSIDVDGMDYWVWDAISCVEPSIVVCEYNSLFGPTRSVTVPYRADFDRRRAHYSHLLFGASIYALSDLAASKGYFLLGSNSTGNNAFFARAGVLQSTYQVAPCDAYVRARFREARNEKGEMTHASFEESVATIRDQVVLDVRAGEMVTVGSLW